MHLKSIDRHLLTKDIQCLNQRFHLIGLELLLTFQRRTRTMKQIKCTALLFMLALLSPLGALARNKNQHSVEIPDSVQVGGTQLDRKCHSHAEQHFYAYSLYCPHWVLWHGTRISTQLRFRTPYKSVARNSNPATTRSSGKELVRRYR